MDPNLSQAAPETEPVPQSQDAQVPEFAPSAEAQTPTEPQTDKPLTREDILAMIRTEAGRIAQRQVSQGESRIQKTIQEKFDALNKVKDTLGLTDQELAAKRQQIVTEAYTSDEGEQQTTPEQPPAAIGADQAIQFMNAQIKIVFDRVGQTVTKADPEFPELQKVIDNSWNDPNGLTNILLTAQQLAATKATRLQKNQNNAAARIVGGGQPSGGQARQVSSAHDAWSEAYKK